MGKFASLYNTSPGGLKKMNAITSSLTVYVSESTGENMVSKPPYEMEARTKGGKRIQAEAFGGQT